MTEDRVFEMVSKAQEFDQIKVRLFIGYQIQVLLVKLLVTYHCCASVSQISFVWLAVSFKIALY